MAFERNTVPCLLGALLLVATFNLSSAQTSTGLSLPSSDSKGIDNGSSPEPQKQSPSSNGMQLQSSPGGSPSPASGNGGNSAGSSSSPGDGSNGQWSPSTNPNQSSNSGSDDGQLKSSPSPAPSSSPGNASTRESGGSAACVSDPTKSECSSFTYQKSDIVRDLDSMCDEKPFLSGCVLYKACQSKPKSSVGKQPETCDEWSLLTTICKYDSFESLNGCRSYLSMCKVTDSQVAQCKTEGMPYLPDTKAANQLVESICERMPSSKGCGRCNFDKTEECPNALSAYGQLCLDNTVHAECGFYSRVCSKEKGDPALFICRFQPDAPAIPGKVEGSSRSMDGFSASSPPPPSWSTSAACRSRHWAVGTMVAAAALVASSLII